METIKTQGIAMPKLGLGTFRMQGDTCRTAVESALSLGYRHIDTAEMYGNEEAIGTALAAARQLPTWPQSAKAFAVSRDIQPPKRSCRVCGKSQ